MTKIRTLWVDDKDNFPESTIWRIQNDLDKLGVDVEIEKLKDGNFVWETIRDWKPHVVMMDNNLESVQTNGGLLILEIRFVQNHDETPIIFYSSGMDDKLIQLVSTSANVTPTTRDDAHVELFLEIKRLIELINAS